jgi:hypothetical protein
MTAKTFRRSLNLPPEMHEQLSQLAAKQNRDVTEADLIRDALRQYLDQQAGLIGSRRHFQKSLQTRVDHLEDALAFHLNVLVYLVSALTPSTAEERITEAIIAARRDGGTLLAQIEAVRKLREEP